MLSQTAPMSSTAVGAPIASQRRAGRWAVVGRWRAVGGAVSGPAGLSVMVPQRKVAAAPRKGSRYRSVDA